MKIVEIHSLRVSFAEQTILRDLNFTISRGEVLTILGANGCGKSTLLRTLSGMLVGDRGEVLLEGKPVGSYAQQELARKLAFLPQTTEVPTDLMVEEWVHCGRYPYQKWWKPASEEDHQVVQQCLQDMRVEHLRHRQVRSLSGGERQRVRIAMALAQEPELLVLDEPTTYLDLCHQLEVMELLRRINRLQAITVVMVLHDINHAARYSDRLLVIHQGNLYAHGTPEEVVTKQMMQDVYSIQAEIVDRQGKPYCYADQLLPKK